jgi:hypothetical protein
MIAPDCLSSADVLARWRKASDRLAADGAHDPDGRVMACNNIPIDPVAGYATGEVFLGSRIEGSPKKTDFVRVMSFRPENGREHILDEAFVARTERTLMDRLHGRPGTRVLYHLVQEMTTGGPLVDVALGVYDLSSGRPIAEKHQEAAYRAAHRLEDEEGLRLF